MKLAINAHNDQVQRILESGVFLLRMRRVFFYAGEIALKESRGKATLPIFRRDTLYILR